MEEKSGVVVKLAILESKVKKLEDNDERMMELCETLAEEVEMLKEELYLARADLRDREMGFHLDEEDDFS